MPTYITPKFSPEKLNQEIDRIFDFLRIPPHMKGYRFLHCAIAIAYMEPERMALIIRDLYTKVSEVFHTNPGCVERNSRTALSCVSSDRVDEMLHRPCLRQGLTLKRFIALMVNYLRYFDVSGD